jgi:hypothetical protein
MFIPLVSERVVFAQLIRSMVQQLSTVFAIDVWGALSICNIFSGYTQILLSKRKKAMQYLMRKDIDMFAKVVSELGLSREASALRGK